MSRTVSLRQIAPIFNLPAKYIAVRILLAVNAVYAVLDCVHPIYQVISFYVQNLSADCIWHKPLIAVKL